MYLIVLFWFWIWVFISWILGHSVAVVKPNENVDVTMVHLSQVFYGTLQTRLAYLTSDGKMWQMICERNSLTNPICLDDRFVSTYWFNVPFDYYSMSYLAYLSSCDAFNARGIVRMLENYFPLIYSLLIFLT